MLKNGQIGIETPTSALKYISPDDQNEEIKIDVNTRQGSIFFRSFASENDIKLVYQAIRKVSGI